MFEGKRLNLAHGRMQVVIPLVRGSMTNALAIQFQLLGCRGIEVVKANAESGSVVIEYNSKRTSLQHALRLLRGLGWMEQHVNPAA
jgi:hypothetical protein